MIARVFVRGFGQMDAEQQKEIVRNTDGIVHKCAHAAEHTVPWILLPLFFRNQGSLKYPPPVSISAGVVMAAADDRGAVTSS